MKKMNEKRNNKIIELELEKLKLIADYYDFPLAAFFMSVDELKELKAKEGTRMKAIRMKTVDDAINELLSEDEYFIRRDGFAFFRIQEIAKKMHFQYWKYRKKILDEIHKWAEQHPYHSVWTDAKGREYIVGYGQQMHPAYGTFREGREEDMLELKRRTEKKNE